MAAISAQPRAQGSVCSSSTRLRPIGDGESIAPRTVHRNQQLANLLQRKTALWSAIVIGVISLLVLAWAFHGLPAASEVQVEGGKWTLRRTKEGKSIWVWESTAGSTSTMDATTLGAPRRRRAKVWSESGATIGGSPHNEPWVYVDVPIPDGDGSTTVAAAPNTLTTMAAAGPVSLPSKVPRVAAGITLHPPKFSFVGRFLEQYSRCPAAMQAMSVHLIFSDAQDLSDFRAGMDDLHADVPNTAWTAVLANLTVEKAASFAEVSKDQLIAAWKKWLGVAYAMDVAEASAESGSGQQLAYSLILDSELLLYDSDDCGNQSAWHNLFTRIVASEDSKLWPAARVNTERTYDFGRFVLNGKQYDQALIYENLQWLLRGDGGLSFLKSCTSKPCNELKRQHAECLFSWWADLPWVNLTIAASLLRAVESSQVTDADDLQLGSTPWIRLVQRMQFPRFEHMCYQQWCVLHEGFHWNDVTNITGPAVWGSYNEFPAPGSNFGTLKPLWVSADAVVRERRKQISQFSSTSPPLLIFHVDHEPGHFKVDRWVLRWRRFLDKRR